MMVNGQKKKHAGKNSKHIGVNLLVTENVQHLLHRMWTKKFRQGGT